MKGKEDEGFRIQGRMGDQLNVYTILISCHGDLLKAPSSNPMLGSVHGNFWP